ncbi:transposase [Burkholderia metallica]|uniref:transposase n=1 Tax=Burkholderia metallica TaxID=488729 RepID=UPI00384D0EAC
MADINFGVYDTNEMVYAHDLPPQIPENSRTVFDKGFLAARILYGLTTQGRNRHFLIPAKFHTRWDVIDGTPDDAMVRMRVSPPARKQSPTLQAGRIVACYQRRWQIETSYRELKQSLLSAELTLRSRIIEGVYQEIWGALIAFNLIRRGIAGAAWETKLDPTDISFVLAFHVIQHEMIWPAVTPAFGKIPAWLNRLHARCAFETVEKQRGHKCPCVVKALPQRYPVRPLKVP